MSTLAVVEEILRETGIPMSVREITERAGARLPSKSKRPDHVVARDLAIDLKHNRDASLFARAYRGRYTLRTLAARQPVAECPEHGEIDLVYGCMHCDPIASRLMVILRILEVAPNSERLPSLADRRRFADIVLRYAANDHASSVVGTGEHKRSLASLRRAARWYAAVEVLP